MFAPSWRPRQEGVRGRPSILANRRRRSRRIVDDHEGSAASPLPLLARTPGEGEQSSGPVDLLLAGVDQPELRPAVPASPRAGPVVGHRAVLAVAHRGEAAGVDAPAGEVVLHRVGAALGQVAVVVAAAAAVGVTGDLQVHVGAVLQDLHGAVEDGVGPGQDLRRASLVVDALDDAGELLHLDGDLVGAAVVVLVVVLGLLLVRALVAAVVDAVVVVVRIRAAVVVLEAVAVLRLVRALVAVIVDAVLVVVQLGTAVLVLEAALVLGLVRAAVAQVGVAVAVVVGVGAAVVVLVAVLVLGDVGAAVRRARDAVAVGIG